MDPTATIACLYFGGLGLEVRVRVWLYKPHPPLWQSKVGMKMFAIKFDTQRFDGVINFSRWQIRMNAILTQHGLKKGLLGKEKKPTEMKDETWVELDEKALMAIQLCLADEVLDEFSSEKMTSALRTKL